MRTERVIRTGLPQSRARMIWTKFLGRKPYRRVLVGSYGNPAVPALASIFGEDHQDRSLMVDQCRGPRGIARLIGTYFYRRQLATADRKNGHERFTTSPTVARNYAATHGADARTGRSTDGQCFPAVTEQ